MDFPGRRLRFRRFAHPRARLFPPQETTVTSEIGFRLNTARKLLTPLSPRHILQPLSHTELGYLSLSRAQLKSPKPANLDVGYTLRCNYLIVQQCSICTYTIIK